MTLYPELPPSPPPQAPPRVLRVNPPGHFVCPACKCDVTCEIEVELYAPQFASKQGKGRFTRCPGCGWNSAMDVFESEYGDG